MAGKSYNRGASNNAAKLTADDVRVIRMLRRTGVKRKTLANAYRVGEYTIRDIMEGRTWGWLDAS